MEYNKWEMNKTSTKSWRKMRWYKLALNRLFSYPVCLVSFYLCRGYGLETNLNNCFWTNCIYLRTQHLLPYCIWLIHQKLLLFKSHRVQRYMGALLGSVKFFLFNDQAKSLLTEIIKIIHLTRRKILILLFISARNTKLIIMTEVHHKIKFSTNHDTYSVQCDDTRQLQTNMWYLVLLKTWFVNMIEVHSYVECLKIEVM